MYSVSGGFQVALERGHTSFACVLEQVESSVCCPVLFRAEGTGGACGSPSATHEEDRQIIHVCKVETNTMSCWGLLLFWWRSAN